MKLKLLGLALLLSTTAQTQTFKELSDSLLFYYQANNFIKAAPFAEQLVVVVKNKYGADNKNYCTFLSLLGGIYFSNKEFEKAEQAFLELKEANKNVFGTGSDEYMKGITLLAVIYNQMGKDRQTIPLLVESLNYYQHSTGDSSFEYASAANRLAKVYEDIGEYEKALPLSERAAIITRKIKGANSEEYATIINNLGLIKKNMGFPEKAEPLLLQAAEIRKKMGGENDPDYANSLNNLATLYTDLGQNAKAFDHYKKAAEIYKKTKGESSFEYLTCLTNLGAAHADLGEYKEAEIVYLEAQAAAKKEYDEHWPLNQQLSYKLGQLYLSMEQFEKAEPLILKHVAEQKNKNSNGIDYAIALNDLAYLYNNTNHMDKAEPLFTESATIIKASMGEGHRDYATALSNLALLYQDQQRYEEAIAAMKKVTTTELNYFLKLFAVLSASEKQSYIQRIEFMQNSNLSCLYRYPKAPASFYRDNFNTQLFLKSLLLTDNRNMLQSIRQSGDTTLKKIVERWQANKKELTLQYALPESSRKKNIAVMESETEEDEKELVRRSAAFRDLRAGLNIKMEDVQAKLKEDEAAIEFVSFRLAGKPVSDSVMYGALILRKSDSIPVFVPLFEEKQLTAIMGNTGGGSATIVNNLYPGKSSKQPTAAALKLYELVWKPLEQYLKGITTIKFAPAGRLNQVAFHAIAVDSNRSLLDKYHLQQFLSTRDIVVPDSLSTTPSTALLIGDADFSTAKPGMVGLAWKKLPGTAKEVAEIKKIFDEKKIAVTVNTGREASEELIKSLDGHSPQLLYIATHGFFLPDNKKTENTAISYGRSTFSNAANPLLRSGLVLTGGNEAWLGNAPVMGKDDGILTAYEVSQLNLSTTDLVVLSACETGLGDIKGTEGVFGLQRAFKLAGAKKMIVSLWKVPDKETSELMVMVNRFWLQGKSIRESLAEARSTMQKKYAPFYWAAFILVE